MERLNIPVGISDFEKIRRNQYYYVDKSGLIEALLNHEATEATLITRPRRFGKTLAMSMLASFFDIRRDSRELFCGLEISRNAFLCKQWMNQYPTLIFSFKRVEGLDFDLVVGAESRGFIFGMPVAYELGKAFVPARKPGKLPRETVSAQYELEYGTSSIELHKDAIRPGQKVVIIDDLIATGGTVKAIAGLVEQLGGQVVKICFVMELAGLKGRERLSGYDVESAIIYEGK